MSKPFDDWLNSFSLEDRDYWLRHLSTHKLETHNWTVLEQLLSNPEFLDAKVRHGMADSVLSDYENALAVITEQIHQGNRSLESTRELFQAFATAFAQELHVIQSSPWLAAQQIYNNLYAHYGDQGLIGDTLKRFAQLDEYPGGNAWLRRLNVSPRTSLSPALLRTISSHSGRVMSLALSFDGNTIISGGHDGILGLWRRQDGSLIQQFPAHSKGITALAPHPFEPDRLQVISAGRDQFIRVWDCEVGMELLGWRAHDDMIRGLTVLLDRQEVISCGDDRVLIGWNINNGQETRRLRGHLGRVFCIASDKNGRRLVSGSEDRTIRVWDWDGDTFQLVRTIRGHLDRVRCVAVSADGKWGVSGSDDTTAIVWDLDTGQPIQTLKGHRERIRAVAILPSLRADTSNFIVTGSDDETVRVWEASTGKLHQILYGHTGGIYSIAAYLREDDWFITGGQDGTLRHWNIARSSEQADAWWEHDARITRFALDSSKTWLASGSEDNTVRLWKTETSTHHSNSRGHFGAITCLAGVGNDYVASGSADSTIRLWNAHTGGLIRIMGQAVFGPDSRVGGGLSREDPWKPNGAITCLLPLDDHTLLSTAKDGFIKMWNIETGELKQKFTIPNGVIQTLAFSRSLGVIVGAGTAREINLWDVQTGQLRAQLKGHSNSVTCMVLLGHNQLVTGSQDKTVGIWDLNTNKQVGSLEKHQQSIRCLTLDPSGNLIISGSDDGSICVWNANSHEHVHTLSGHTEPVRALMSGPGDNHVYSAGLDQQIILWNTELGIVKASTHIGNNITALASLSPTRICVGTQPGGLAFFELEGMQVSETSLDKSVRIKNEPGEVVSTGTSLRLPIQFSPDIGLMRQNYRAAGDGTRTLYIVQQVYPSDPESSLEKSPNHIIPSMDMQENIYKFCKQMIETEGVHLITVEGAEQKLESISPARSIAEIMARHTDVSAGVLCSLDEFSSLIDVWGVDDLQIVQPSWQIMNELRQLREVRERVFNKFRELLRKAQSLYYSSDIIKLRSHLKLYAGYISLTEEVVIIRDICEQVGLAFSTTFPLLDRLYQLQEMEGKFHWELLEKQRAHLVSLTANRILGWRNQARKQYGNDRKFLHAIVGYWVKHTGQSKAEYLHTLQQRGKEEVLWEYQNWYTAWLLHQAYSSRFVRGQMNGSDGQSKYLQEMLELADVVGTSSSEHSDLRLYAQYLAAAGMEPETLSDELNECRLMLIDHLKSEKAIWLRNIEDRADFLYTTLRLENTPIDVEIADFTSEDLQGLLARLCTGLHEPFPEELASDIQTLNQGVILGRSFSGYSFQRSQHMIRRTLEIMQESNEYTAIIVTGGFHTRTVIRVLEDYTELNWHVFTPKLDIDLIKKSDPSQGYVIS